MTCGLLASRCREILMLRFKTHFEQVPLETVRKIVREQIQREAMNDDEINKETLEKGLAAVEEPTVADVASFLTGRYRNDS
jgi:predicted type IV restriction endonuclease